MLRACGVVGSSLKGHGAAVARVSVNVPLPAGTHDGAGATEECMPRSGRWLRGVLPISDTGRKQDEGRSWIVRAMDKAHGISPRYLGQTPWDTKVCVHQATAPPLGLPTGTLSTPILAHILIWQPVFSTKTCSSFRHVRS